MKSIRLFFLEGKFASDKIHLSQKRKAYQHLKSEIAEEAGKGQRPNSGKFEPELAASASLIVHKRLGIVP
jgi:hypothetical protein